MENLSWFVTIIETENMTDAAAMLGLDQSTLSRKLARLEAELGTNLVDRHGRSIRANSRGRAFAQAALRSAAAIDKGKQDVRRLLDPEAGHVRFGFMHSLGPWLAPRIVQTFLTTYPQATIEILQSDSDHLAHLVAVDQLDVALCSADHLDVAHLQRRLLRRQTLGVFMAPGHRLAGRTQVDMAELAGEQFITAPPGFTTRRILEACATGAGFRPSIIATSEVLATAAGMAAAGVGITLLPLDDPTLTVTGPVVVPLTGRPSRDLSLLSVASQVPIVARFCEVAAAATTRGEQAPRGEQPDDKEGTKENEDDRGPGRNIEGP